MLNSTSAWLHLLKLIEALKEMWSESAQILPNLSELEFTQILKIKSLEFQRSDIRASLNLSLFGAFGVGSLVAFRIVFDFWRSFKYLIQIRTFRLFSKCSKFSRRYTWHNVSAINYDFFERFMVFHFIRSKLVLNIISSLIKYHYSSVVR